MFPGIRMRDERDERPKPFRVIVTRTYDGGYLSDTAIVVDGLVFESWHAFDRLLVGLRDPRNIHLDTETGDVHLVGCVSEKECLGRLEVVSVEVKK